MMAVARTLPGAASAVALLVVVPVAVRAVALAGVVDAPAGPDCARVLALVDQL